MKTIEFQIVKMGYVFRYQEHKLSMIDKLKVAAGTEKPSKLRLHYMTADNTDSFSEADLRELANSTYEIENVRPIVNELDSRLSESEVHWRSIEKALELLQFMLCYGSADLVDSYTFLSSKVESLCNYQGGNNGKDTACIIRASASEIVSLMEDKPILEDKRYNAAKELGKMNKRKVARANNIYDQKMRKDYALSSAPIAGGF